jgi:hypothetical protein
MRDGMLREAVVALIVLGVAAVTFVAAWVVSLAGVGQ